MSFLKGLPSRTDFCSGGYSAVNQFYIQTYRCTHDQTEPEASQKIKNNPRQLLIKLPRSPVVDKEENIAPLPNVDEKMPEQSNLTKKRPLNMIINKETEERKSKRIKSTATREPEPALASVKYTPMKKNDKKITVSLRSSSKTSQTDQQKENSKINTAEPRTKQSTLKLTEKKAQAINTIAEKNQLRHTKELLGLLFGKSRKKKSTN